ncbi:MAG TPA: signal peptidase I [Bacillota bacterium]|nr:signal peptidase I [Bacillota bacterium]
MKIIEELASWVAHFLAALVLALALCLFVLQPTYVEGRSMEDTLHDGDKVLISKLLHTFGGEPEYGDIVIIDSRVNRPRTFRDDLREMLTVNLFTRYFFGLEGESHYWIKRVIGKEGDYLEFRGCTVFRNGVPLEEPYVREAAEYKDLEPVKVPEDCIFVMGDNRNDSRDSRHIGCVPLSHVLGKYKFNF